MSDFRITIDVKDVAKGDVRNLVAQIEVDHGDDFDMARGDFVVSVSEKQGDRYFVVDLEED